MSLERLMVEMEVTLNDISNDLKLRVTWEGYLSREHDVKHNTEGPDVDLLIVVLQEDFRCNVVRLQTYFV